LQFGSHPRHITCSSSFCSSASPLLPAAPPAKGPKQEDQSGLQRRTQRTAGPKPRTRRHSGRRWHEAEEGRRQGGGRRKAGEGCKGRPESAGSARASRGVGCDGSRQAGGRTVFVRPRFSAAGRVSLHPSSSSRRQRPCARVSRSPEQGKQSACRRAAATRHVLVCRDVEGYQP
jgi:hypothetical protein